MKITNNFASTIIGTVSGRITYNGRTINIPQSSRMELVDGQILIDGKPFEQYDKADCPIIKIELTGNVEHVQTQTGDVEVHGDVHNAKTMSGDITCDCIKGHCSTMSGDIRR
ncbi:hypothetical protein [Prevotellamassilia timonensis]|jgi:hypothetical protein|uniref:hypothetical protein n=1 Tax=Prevotellamassilia timonensis TaxID=1852370 RepID=UPI00205065F9|nr:MAG TPA: hypothetical protein [Caudoviricetes sp.]